VKVIFFGMGSIGWRHYRIMQKLYPDFHYYAYKRERYENSPLASIYSWDEVESINADLAFICNPTDKHLDFALECAKRKINLFIEKPLSNSLEKVKELMYYVNLNRLHVLVGYNLRFHPIIEKIKGYIDSTNDHVIRFSAYCGSYLPDWRNNDYKNSYSAKRAQGGGVVLDLSHEIDYCRWIWGNPEKVIGCYGKYSELEIETEDNLEVILQYRGKVGVIHLDYYRLYPRREVEVLTDQAVLFGDLINGIFSIKTRQSDTTEHVRIYPDLTYEKQLTHLVGLLEGNSEPRCSLEDSVETMQLLMKIKGDLL